MKKEFDLEGLRKALKGCVRVVDFKTIETLQYRDYADFNTIVKDNKNVGIFILNFMFFPKGRHNVLQIHLDVNNFYCDALIDGNEDEKLVDEIIRITNSLELKGNLLIK